MTWLLQIKEGGGGGGGEVRGKERGSGRGPQELQGYHYLRPPKNRESSSKWTCKMDLCIQNLTFLLSLHVLKVLTYGRLRFPVQTIQSYERISLKYPTECMHGFLTIRKSCLTLYNWPFTF